jgi:hypothetical protein
VSKDKGALQEIFDTAMGVLLANAVGKGLKKIRKLLFRWRRALTPLWIGFFIWLTSVIIRWQAPDWWWAVLIIPVLGLLAAILGPKLSERWARVVMAVVPDGLDKGKDGVLDRPVERAYFGSLMVVIGLYMSIRITMGPSEFTGWVWQIAEVLWGGSWWYHRRVRVVGRADKFVKRWPVLADKETCPYRLTPLVGSKVIAAKSRGRTSVLTIELAPAQTADAVAHLTGAIASFYNLRKGSVFVSDQSDKARHVTITFLPKDPWKGKIPHPIVMEGVKPGSLSLRELGKKFTMGVYAYGEALIYELQHTLVVGASGSGKSGWLHSLMMWLTSFSDCIVVGIDMAAGATLNVWERALALPLARDVDQAVIILERVLGVIRDREIHLGLKSEEEDDAADSFEPKRETPWLVLVIDEFPDLLAEAKMTTRYNVDGKADGNYEKYVILLLSRIAKKARKCGIRMVLASQNGTKTDLGSKEMQAQLRAIVGLTLDMQQSRNLWGTLMNQGWKSTDLSLGQFLLKDDDHTQPEIAKGYWVENKDRRAHVKAAAELHRQLEPTANAILMGLSEVDDFIDGDVVEEEEQPFGPERDVLEYLRSSGPARVEEISTVLTEAKGPNDKHGTSRASIYRHLNALLERGLVRSDEGVWKVVEEVPVQRKVESEPGTEMVSIQGEQMR